MKKNVDSSPTRSRAARAYSNLNRHGNTVAVVTPASQTQNKRRNRNNNNRNNNGFKYELSHFQALKCGCLFIAC